MQAVRIASSGVQVAASALADKLLLHLRPGRNDADDRRALRVTLLLLAVSMMSLVDLLLTLTYATTIGMVEHNPLARAIMSYDCPGLLSVWKLLSVGLAIFILYRLRRSPKAEIGAWICCVLLTALSFHWVRFNDTASTLVPIANDVLRHSDDRFVLMDP